MTRARFSFGLLLHLALMLAGVAPGAEAKWKYYRSGKPQDSQVTPKAGYALMGGGGNQDLAFKFLCERANGGDFLILRASGDDKYIEGVDQDLMKTCPLNSASTILFDDRENADDKKVVEIIEQAEAIFFAGGDQSNYVRYWQDTPVMDALNRHIARAKPLGGSSAGLAILGEYGFSSIIDTIHSPEALANPYGNKVTISRDFLKIPVLEHTITDTHFVKRDRLGRLLVFMARILQDGWTSSVRAIAVDENAAVLVEADGVGTVVGGPAYFLSSTKPPGACRYRAPLSMEGVETHHAPAGSTFDLKKWQGQGGDDYVLEVREGSVTQKGSNHGLY